MGPQELTVGYRAYNLGIHSELPLSELPRDASTIDVNVHIGPVIQRPSVFDASRRGYWGNGTQACYVLKDVGAFLVSNGRDVLLEPFPEAAGELLRLSLLGPAMALVLHQRGTFVLHAGAVVINGAAIVFLGGHGWGKSTLVAMLYARGHEFVCEDVAGLQFLENQVQVVPSFPQLKLWPNSAQSLGWSPNDFPQIHPAWPKRLIRFKERFATRPIPVRRIYVLSVGAEVCVERFRPVEKFETILQHRYGIRFGREFQRNDDRLRQMRETARLVRTIPVKKLRRPATLQNAPRLAEAIEKAILRDLELEDDNDVSSKAC